MTLFYLMTYDLSIVTLFYTEECESIPFPNIKIFQVIPSESFTSSDLKPSP